MRFTGLSQDGVSSESQIGSMAHALRHEFRRDQTFRLSDVPLRNDSAAIIQKVLFPVDFSSACIGAAPFIRRLVNLQSAQLTLLHVIQPFDFSAFELYVRPYPDVKADHWHLAQQRLDSFLQSVYPSPKYPRLLVSGPGSQDRRGCERAAIRPDRDADTCGRPVPADAAWLDDRKSPE